MAADTMPAATQDLRERLTADPGVFARFYRDALPVVYGYLLHRCGSRAAAEDLTQETFLAAALELKNGREIRNPLAWILGIARHKLLDHYRRERRNPQSESDDEVAHDLDPLAGESAANALAAVPPSQRAALLLRHVDGYSVPEIAELLGRTIDSVDSLLVRGRAGFRRAYLEEMR